MYPGRKEAAVMQKTKMCIRDRPYDAGIVMEDGAGPPADGIWAPEGRKENRKG